MVTRADIVAAARTWIGVRWQHQGRTRHGIDCIGLPVVVAFELGLIAAMPAADYPRRPNGTFLARFRETALIEILPNQVQSGDVLVFAQQTAPCHCGILTTLHGESAIIHAYAAARKVTRETLAAATHAVGVWTHAFQFPNLTE